MGALDPRRWVGLLARWGWDHAHAVWAGWALFLLVAGVSLTGLRLDTSLEGLLGHDSPEVQAAAAIKQRFGTDESVAVVVQAEAIRTEATLRRLHALREDLAATVPHLTHVDSVVDAPLAWTSATGRIHLGPALQPWPDAEVLPERLRAVQEASAYEGLFVSEDDRLAVILLTLEAPPPGQITTPPDRAHAVMDAVRTVVDRHQHATWTLLSSGKVALPEALATPLAHDVVRYLIAATLVSVLLLLLRFRHPLGVLLPLAVTAPAVLGTLGAMAALDVPLQLPSLVLPPLVLVLGVAGVVHVLQDLDQRQRTLPWGRDLVVHTLEHKAEALSLAALTTALGMASLTASTITPAAVVGRFGMVAALLGWASTALLVPAGCRLVQWPAASDRSDSPAFRRVGRAVAQHARALSLASALLTAATGAVALQHRFVHDPLSWLPPDWEVRQATVAMDEAMAVTMDLDLVIDTGRRGGAVEPAWLDRLDQLEAALEAEGWGTVHTLLDPLRSLAADRPSGELRPADVRLLQSFAPRATAQVLSDDGAALRLMVRTRATDAAAYPAIRDRALALARQHAPEATVQLGGMLPLFARTWEAVGSSAALAWPLATLGGAGLMALVVRSLRRGVWLMLPNLLPATGALAVLWALGGALDLFTLLTVSLAMGVVVDDAIHLVGAWREAYATSGDPAQATEDALAATGPAMVLTTALLVGGWATLVLSPIPAVWTFAGLSALTLGLGLVADLVATPALLAWLAPRPRTGSPAASLGRERP